MHTGQEADRLSKVETDVALITQQVKGLEGAVASMLTEQREFRAEWQRTKAAEAQAETERASAGRLTMPQIFQMMASAAAVTALILGGGLWMMTSVASSVRSDALAQQAQIGLQVRSVAEAMTATQATLQVLQRDNAIDRVKLGLVEQIAAQTSRSVEGMQGFDAQFARHDEQIKGLQQAIRDMIARQNALARGER
jgi:regulator of replication initiation timing